MVCGGGVIAKRCIMMSGDEAGVWVDHAHALLDKRRKRDIFHVYVESMSLLMEAPRHVRALSRQDVGAL